MHSLRRVLAAWVLLGLMGPVAQAATAPVKGNLGATSSVVNTCVIQSADSISFGSYAPINATATTGQGQLLLKCTKGAAVNVVPTSGGSAMTGAGGSLAYSLYTDSGFSKQWGSPGVTNNAINFSTGANFASNSSGLSLAQCAALSNGMLYAYQPTGQYANSTNFYASSCYYGASQTGAGVGAISGSYNAGLTINGQVVVAASPKTGGPGNTSTFGGMVYYAPSGTSLGGYTYSVPSSLSTALALTGTATSAATPATLTYYGKVPAGQNVSAGAYTDTVVVQVAF